MDINITFNTESKIVEDISWEEIPEISEVLYKVKYDQLNSFVNFYFYSLFKNQDAVFILVRDNSLEVWYKSSEDTAKIFQSDMRYVNTADYNDGRVKVSVRKEKDNLVRLYVNKY